MLAGFLDEVVVGRVDCGMPQHIFDEVRRVLLQQDLVPLLEYFKHVVVQVLIQRHVLVVLVLRVVDTDTPGVGRPRRSVVLLVIIMPVVVELAPAATPSLGTASSVSGLHTL